MHIAAVATRAALYTDAAKKGGRHDTLQRAGRQGLDPARFSEASGAGRRDKLANQRIANLIITTMAEALLLPGYGVTQIGG